MRKGEQIRERILARSAQLFNRRREAIGRMSFTKRKKRMMSFAGDYYPRQISAVLYDRMHLIHALLCGEPTVTPAYATTLDSSQVTEEFIFG